MLLFVGLLFVLEKNVHSVLCLYLGELFYSLPILIPILLLYCQFSLFFGVLDKGVTGLFLLEFFTKVLMVYA